MNQKTTCLLIYSGGLDSTLAVKVLEEQGIDVTAINFVSYFFGSKTAEKTARENNIKLRIFDDEGFKREHWEIVQKPKYGHGSAINPCIDCHLLMFKWAGKIMRGEVKLLELAEVEPSRTGEDSTSAENAQYDFVASGEVLGERPMSQNKRALELIEKQSGLKGYLLRPLSAKLLDETEVEKRGLVDRARLLNLSGRGRTRQMELAKKYGLNYYPTPGGGCVLTDKTFSEKLKDLLEKIGAENIKPVDLQLLKIGRHFWLDANNLAVQPPSANLECVTPSCSGAQENNHLERRVPSWYKIVLGRNKEENEQLKVFMQKNDVLIIPKNFSGPTALAKIWTSDVNNTRKGIEEAKKLILKYSKTDKILGNLEFDISG